METLKVDTLEKILALGQTQARTFTAESEQPGTAEPLIIVPSGYEVQSLAQFVAPTVIRQHVQVTDADSFIAYLEKYKLPDTMIFAEISDTDAVFRAVIDYHQQGGPERCAHTVGFKLQQTTEWQRWIGNNGSNKAKNQVDFATWLEENADLLVKPSGAELLEVVQTLEGHCDARFNQAIKLQSGAVRLNYEEDIVVKGACTATAGQIELPRTIEAGIAPFHGLEAYRIEARLKFKLYDRKLTFWFETINPHRIIRDAVASVVTKVAEETDLPIINGKL